MASDKRPGGLTALAVINFIFGGLSGLSVLGMLALIPFMDRLAEQASTQDLPPESAAQIEALSEVSGTLFVTLALVSLVTAVLLILSGIGYLKLKKFLGRTLGNVYAIASIVSSAGSAIALPQIIGGGFNIMAIVGLIYPVLTLILLNTTFRDDFVN